MDDKRGSNDVLRLFHSTSMMLATVELDGKLVGPWVDEVRTTVATLRGGRTVRLDLQHLSFADAAGLKLLCTLRREGILLVGASPLIDGLLASQGGQQVQQHNAGES